MSTPATATLDLSGRTYELPPRPVCVVCVDGCADEYLDAALARDRMPTIRRMARDGWRGIARGALPAFTNTNNASIVTGVPPSVHGVSGNFFLDPETGEEVMMNEARFLRAPTLLAAAERAGRKVAVVTAKDKLRRMLGHGLESGIAWSVETSGEEQAELAAMEVPEIYSAEASVFAMRVGAALAEAGRADLLYLSLTDYVQHKHAPDDPVALDFHAALDREFGRLLDAGCALGVTADHGMSAKQTPDGAPNVVYLEEHLGEGARVVLPITDPYVKHHGALGSFAVVHLADPARAAEVRDRCLAIDGVTEAHVRADAARLLELPEDRIGDVVVLSARNVALGRSPAAHDLTAVQRGLRSHGGRYEEMVPFVVSDPVPEAYRRRVEGDLRSFEIFEVTLNAAAAG